MNAADKLKMSSLMNLLFGEGSWTVDLEDCDKVLRVCCVDDQTELIMNALKMLGYSGELLDY